MDAEWYRLSPLIAAQHQRRRSELPQPWRGLLTDAMAHAAGCVAETPGTVQRLLVTSITE
jgi:hypothetical protein